MIYSEETETIDFSKGLWITDSKDLHPGYCSTLRNLIVTPNGTLWPRPTFIPAFSAGAVYSSSAEISVEKILPYRSIPYYPSKVTRPSVLAPNDALTNVPAYIEPHDSLSAAIPVNIRAVNRGVTSAGHYISKTNHSISNGYYATNFVQYGDRIYAYLSGSGIKRVSGWDFTAAGATSLTETNIAGSPTVASALYSYSTFLDVYKDRLFLTFGNRIYFTETAAVGGYPETWNISTNFLTLPTLSVMNTFIFNNIMYLFTGSGLWTLQVQGPPESWILKQVNEGICISHPSAVCFNDGVFYYTMLNKIYAFNGYDRPLELSQPINEYLLKCRGIGIFAYEDGCIVCTETYTPKAADSDAAKLAITRWFYFNGATWCEIDRNESDTEGRFSVIVGTAVLVTSELSNDRPTTYITVIEGLYGDTPYEIQTYFVDKLHVYGDSNSMNPTTGAVTITNPFKWQLVPAPISKNFLREKRHKLGYLSLLCNRDDYDINYQMSIDGYEFKDIGTLTLEKEFASEDRNFLAKFEVDTYARRLQIRFEGFIPYEDISGGGLNLAVGIPVNSAPLEITSLSILGNTGRSEAEDVTG